MKRKKKKTLKQKIIEIIVIQERTPIPSALRKRRKRWRKLKVPRYLMEMIEEGAFDIFAASRKDLTSRCRDYYEGGGRSGLFAHTAYRAPVSKKKKKPDSQLSFFDEDEADKKKS